MNSKYRRHAALTASLAMAALAVCGCLSKNPPKAFDLLSPEDGATGVEYRPTLTWSESAGAKTFSLWLSTSEGVFGTEELLIADAPWTTSLELPEDLARGRTYWWRVEARNSDGRTACAEDHCFRIEFSVLHVDASAVGANDGSTWADAFTSIDDALDASTPGDEVWVAAGLYRPTRRTDLDDPRTATFAMVDGVGIYGGFAGGETDFGERDWQTNETVLCGDIGVAGSAADNAYHVVLGADDAVLDGFTVTNGNANGASGHRNGGGMYNLATSDLTVSNCIFAANQADQDGGGMYNSGGRSTVTNCIFTDNRAGWRGGGMGNSSFVSDTFVTSCAFSRNDAHSGGGLYSGGGRLTATNCTIVGNKAEDNGGGIHGYSTMLVITNCIIWGNAAPMGAPVYRVLGPISVTYSCIEELWGGEGNTGGNPLLSNVPLEADVSIADGTAQLVVILYVGDRYAVGDVIEIARDGVARTVTGVSDLTVTFTPALNEPSAAYTFVSNWGPGATDLTMDLRLSPSSPCIDAGTNAPFIAGGAAEGVTTDLDGNPRIVGGRVDIGAYEYQGR